MLEDTASGALIFFFPLDLYRISFKEKKQQKKIQPTKTKKAKLLPFLWKGPSGTHLPQFCLSAF